MSYTTGQLVIRGYHDEAVPNTFFEQSEKAGHIAIILPGISYSCEMPLLYYLTGLFLSMKADVLWVQYAYAQRQEFKTSSDDEKRRWLLADVAATCQAVLAHGLYLKVSLCGKSLGTLAMGHLLSADSSLIQAQAIWLTPVLNDERLRTQILATKQRSLMVIGTADTNYDAAFVKKVESLENWEALVLDRADHSLEIDDNVFRSLSAMEQIMRRTQAFLAK